jgi:hypothetical protein
MRLHSKNLGSAKEGMLKLSHLGTHEKVLIQDEELFMNTSFNFLSYTGVMADEKVERYSAEE